MQQRQGFSIRLPSNPESMREVQNCVAQLLAELEYSQRDCFSVRLALEEALANAVKHGNGRDESKKFEVRCQANSEVVEIEVCDQGAGFSLEQVPSPTEGECLFNPNGRGVALMERFMDHIEYRSNGSSVLMQKRRSPVEA
jgi:serine/threonine-protein kinase RsbW